MENINITFDDTGKIRLIDPVQAKKTQEMKDSCDTFIKSIEGFMSSSSDSLKIMESYASKIEKAKLKAIGQKNLVDTEKEGRNRRKNELMLLLEEKQNELERKNDEYKSLLEVENEQKRMINFLIRTDIE